MKLLTLLVFTTTLLAQVKVNVENLKNGRKFGAKFETLEDANAWINSQRQERSWGKLDRWVRLEEGMNEDECDQTRQVEPEKGEAYTECLLLQDFIVTIEDISDEVQAKLQEEQERVNEIRQIKQAINLIKSSDKPAWEKKLLIRLTKELKE